MKRASALPTALCLLLLFGHAARAPAHPHPGPDDVRIRAGRVFDGFGWTDDTLVVVRHGVIHDVGRASGTDGDGSVGAEDGFLTPGLVDLHAVFGLADGAIEGTEAISADLQLIDAFDLSEEEAEAFRRSGVTTAWLAPGPVAIPASAEARLHIVPKA